MKPRDNLPLVGDQREREREARRARFQRKAKKARGQKRRERRRMREERALNETAQAMVRVFTPFAFLIAVALAA